MKIRCTASMPTNQQADQLGARFDEHQQQFPIEPGTEYLVFGVEIYGGIAWVVIEHEAGYLFEAPLMLFEIVDDRVPHDWRLRLEENGDLRLLPIELFDRYFLDDLSERVPHAIEIFRDLKHRYTP